jgi:hypothetical protein
VCVCVCVCVCACGCGCVCVCADARALGSLNCTAASSSRCAPSSERCALWMCSAALGTGGAWWIKLVLQLIIRESDKLTNTRVRDCIHMAPLQRGESVAMWGVGAAQGTVTVTVGGSHVFTNTSSSDGSWTVGGIGPFDAGSQGKVSRF